MDIVATSVSVRCVVDVTQVTSLVRRIQLREMLQNTNAWRSYVLHINALGSSAL